MNFNFWNNKAFKISLMVAALLCLPITGLIYGFIICSDCGDGIASIPGRLFLGLIYSFFTVLSLGKPWVGGGVITSTNLRGYVLLTFLIIFLIVYILKIIKLNRTQRD